MSDAAARRRQRILAAAGNRMAVVSGLAGGAEDETAQEAAEAAPAAAAAPATVEPDADAAAGSEEPAPSSGVGSSGGSARARARRLQSRNIAALEGAASTANFSTAPTSTTAAPDKGEEGGDEAAVDANATPAVAAAATAPAPASMSLPSLETASFTTGGNALRRRFHASKGSVGGNEGELGLAKGESEAAKASAAAHPILAKAQQRSGGFRRFVDAALATDAGLRFLLVFVAGLAAGVWAAVANAGVLAEGFEQRSSVAAATAQEVGAASGPRAALDAFVSSSSSAGSSGIPDYTATSGSKGLLGWVRGLFLPPVFDSWPLPALAVLLHVAAALLAPLLLRLRSGSTQQSTRAAILARMPSADGTPPPPPPPPNAGASGGKEKDSKSFVETMALQMGLGPLLDLFRFAQAAWQDVLLFSLAFLLALSVAGASEAVLLALMSGGGGGGMADSATADDKAAAGDAAAGGGEF